MFSQVKALVQQMLGPAYDYVMPLVGILIPFRYPGNFYWLFCLSTLAIALVLLHGLPARMGVVTGQGLIGLVRQR